MSVFVLCKWSMLCYSDGGRRAVMMLVKVILCCASWSLVCGQKPQTRPHIVFIIADDLGFNDVGFHGSNQVPTPNIDALALAGLVLHDYYVTPICTPSRAALMTGKYPIHTGMQHTVLYGMEPRGLPLSEKLLPQYLKELGYHTHLVGKWHLGNYKRVYTPLYRGFDSHLGYWTGKIDFYDHTTVEHNTWGFDIRRGMDVAHDLFGQYITDVLTAEAVRVVQEHNASEPLYLEVAHAAVHSGNPYTPLRAPDALVASFANITDPQRQKFAGMLSKMDESVGAVVEALAARGLLQDTVLVFTTDNGGPAAGFNDNAASNYPLRGVKNTLWEGGVRGAALLWSPRLQGTSRLSTQTMHISDWLPTLYSAAGGDPGSIQNIDGMDLWEALSKDLPSPRREILHNIDDIYGSASLTSEGWKVHKGTNYGGAWDSWYGPQGREGTYDAGATAASAAGRALAQLGLLPDRPTMEALREKATVRCEASEDTSVGPRCQPLLAPCLFHVASDPCERTNLANQEPAVLQRLLARLDELNSTAVPPSNLPDDLRGDPKNWGRIYTNFGDYL